MEEGYSLCLNKWALDKDIKNELGLLLIISSLCAEKGYCYASNQYLAKLFNITDVSISSKIKKLEKKNYIIVDYKKRGCEVISREIRLKNILTDDKDFFYSTIKNNFNEKIKSIKNYNYNNNIYSEIIDYLNEKVGSHYKSNISKTKSLIQARLNEKFTLEDFKKVIDNKCLEWMGTEWQKYLRPETLFGTKFEGYLNSQEKKLPTWFGKEIKKEEVNEERKKLAEQLTNGTWRP